jgi:hypothetical protein
MATTQKQAYKNRKNWQAFVRAWHHPIISPPSAAARGGWMGCRTVAAPVVRCGCQFFLYYLLRFEVPGQNTISDSLFSDGAYKVIIAVLLAVLLTFGARLFLLRFSGGWGAWESLWIAGMCVTFVAW